MRQVENRIEAVLEDFHTREPLKPGMSKAELKENIAKVTSALFESAITGLKEKGKITEQQQWIKKATHEIKLSPADEKAAQKITGRLSDTPFNTPSEGELSRELGLPSSDTQRILKALQGLGKIQRMEGDIYFHADAIARAREELMKFGREHGEISVSQYREQLNTSRKYALALLSHFDHIGLTERVGDVRVIHLQ